jgi:hypothetical protein
MHCELQFKKIQKKQEEMLTTGKLESGRNQKLIQRKDR